MPRNRTVRLAVLGSSVQRAAHTGFPSSRSSALKRRIVVGVLLLASLVLITVSFRSTALDGVRRGLTIRVLRDAGLISSLRDGPSSRLATGDWSS